jgi:hypothetical protein
MDRPGDRPDENDGDADDLMVYMQPVVPGVDIASSGGDDGGPAVREGPRGAKAKSEWIREVVQRFLSWMPLGLIRF